MSAARRAAGPRGHVRSADRAQARPRGWRGSTRRSSALYAKGLTTGEIQAHLAEIYDADVSRDLVSKVTDKFWRSWRVAEPTAGPRLSGVLIDAIMSRSATGRSPTGPSMWRLGVNLAGERDVLGMWVGTGGEGAKHWMTCWPSCVTGRADVCIVACDGLKGLPDAITETWPQAIVQPCVVHLVRAVCVTRPKRTGGDHPALRTSTPPDR